MVTGFLHCIKERKLSRREKVIMTVNAAVAKTGYSSVVKSRIS